MVPAADRRAAGASSSPRASRRASPRRCGGSASCRRAAPSPGASTTPTPRPSSSPAASTAAAAAAPSPAWPAPCRAAGCRSSRPTPRCWPTTCCCCATWRPIPTRRARRRSSRLEEVARELAAAVDSPDAAEVSPRVGPGRRRGVDQAHRDAQRRADRQPRLGRRDGRRGVHVRPHGPAVRAVAQAARAGADDLAGEDRHVHRPGGRRVLRDQPRRRKDRGRGAPRAHPPRDAGGD